MIELAYCTNVHPATTLAGVQDQLERWCAPIAGRVPAAARPGGLGVGLWLARVALSQLEEDFEEGAAELRAGLERSGLRCVTLNAFPYDAFHADRVKASVYRPDWRDDSRREFTEMAARVLAALLPGGETLGTISTLPLGDALGWGAEDSTRAAKQLGALAENLAALRERTGKRIVVCLEPEPECVLERSDQAVRFFTETLPSAGVSAELIGEHLGLCWDCCHQAVQFEDPTAAVGTLVDAGIHIGKVQVSSALEVPDPDQESARERLVDFDEPRFLHQVRVQRPDGAVESTRDLPDALEDGGLPTDGPWRVHFHVPIGAAQIAGVQTTRAHLRDSLAALRSLSPQTRHYEVETYTWNVLPVPEAERAEAVVAGIASELSTAHGWLEALEHEVG